MAQQYYNYLSPGIEQVMLLSDDYADYNYPANYQSQAYYNQQPVQLDHRYQYDSRYYYPIMSNAGGSGGAQQPEQQPSESNAASGSTLYYCFWQPCAGQNKAFKRKADLDRHIAAMHTRSMQEMIDCEDPTCHRRGDYGFVRRDKMIEHMRDVHKKNIPKRGKKG